MQKLTLTRLESEIKQHYHLLYVLPPHRPPLSKSVLMSVLSVF